MTERPDAAPPKRLPNQDCTCEDEKHLVGERLVTEHLIDVDCPIHGQVHVLVMFGALLAEAVECDGDHHSRWYLEQIAGLFGVPVGERRGIAP